MATLLFDLWKVYDLDNQTVEAKFAAYAAVRKFLPEVRLHSRQSVCEQLKKRFGIVIPDAKIATLTHVLDGLHENDEDWQCVYGILEYLKQHYLQKNYTACILKHGKEVDGGIELELTEHHGVFWLPNKQKLFHSALIWDCVIKADPDYLSRDYALLQHKGDFNGSNI